MFSAYTAVLIFSSALQLIDAKSTTNVCPILGPAFPAPTQISSSKYFKNATQSIDNTIDTALREGKSRYGDAPFNETTFSVGVFSTHDTGLNYERHFTDPSVANSPVGTHHVNADSIYRIGSISKLLTMYILLMVDGDRSYNHAITEYVPELAASNATSAYGVLPQWDQITVADLATHLSGILSDYGANEEEFGDSTKGWPKLPKNRVPRCGYETDTDYITCSREEELRGLESQPVLFETGSTPSYSNSGYDLIGFVVENITGKSMSQNFNESLVKALNLTHTYFTIPSDTTYGAIPVNETVSRWNEELGPGNPDGGNFISTNDMATVGKAIMNSTLLPKAVTRRWLKPRTFTGDPVVSVGAPWEIYRWETPAQTYYLYTKEGGEGMYATIIALLPELDLGFSVMTTGADYRPDIQELISNSVADPLISAVQETAREQARQNFAGRYFSKEGNHSVTITTDDQPGLRITEWRTGGVDIFPDLDDVDEGQYLDVRLWPNQLYRKGQVGFTATWGGLPRTAGKRPITDCATWSETGSPTYGNVAVGAFVFDVDAASGKAARLHLKAFSATLERQAAQ